MIHFAGRKHWHGLFTNKLQRPFAADPSWTCGYDGTADVVAYARRQGIPVHVIWPDGAERDG